jgi:hypothetical protein
MADKNYTTFIDNAGRAIFGEVNSDTKDSLQVKNPVMITVQQQQNGQMAVQLFPLFFQEFVNPGENDRRDNFFTYPDETISSHTLRTVLLLVQILKLNHVLSSNISVLSIRN